MELFTLPFFATQPDLLAVWEKDGRKWYLLQLARPQSAIALARENLGMRLVFPTAINPNHLSKEHQENH